MILSSEGFLANIAFVGPLISVGSFVDHQVVAFGKVTLAESKRRQIICLKNNAEAHLLENAPCTA